MHTSAPNLINDISLLLVLGPLFLCYGGLELAVADLVMHVLSCLSSLCDLFVHIAKFVPFSYQV